MAPATQTDSTTAWNRRLERARDLTTEHPATAAILRFYAEVLAFQARVARKTDQRADIALSLRDQIDLSPALALFPELLASARSHGPTPLAEAAKNLQNSGPSTWRELLSAPPDDATLDAFFARASVQPLAEVLQVQFPVATDQSTRLCPVCGGLPQLVILRPEGEGARRSLLCSFCLREWAFRRVLCPYCGETDKEKLPYFTDQDCRHVRVEACDTCQHYLKSIDLSLDGLAIPLVDEVALSALDIWAAEHGYRKIQHNLIGL